MHGKDFVTTGKNFGICRSLITTPPDLQNYFSLLSMFPFTIGLYFFILSFTYPLSFFLIFLLLNSFSPTPSFVRKNNSCFFTCAWVTYLPFFLLSFFILILFILSLVKVREMQSITCLQGAFIQSFIHLTKVAPSIQLSFWLPVKAT